MSKTFKCWGLVYRETPDMLTAAGFPTKRLAQDHKSREEIVVRVTYEVPHDR